MEGRLSLFGQAETPEGETKIFIFYNGIHSTPVK